MLGSVKSKVTSVYVVLVLVIAILGGASIFSIDRISNRIDGLIEANYYSIQRINKMNVAIDALQATLFSYLYVETYEDSWSIFERQTKDFLVPFDEAMAAVNAPLEIEMMEKIGSEFERYVQMKNGLFEFDLEDVDSVYWAKSFYQYHVSPQLRAVKYELQNFYDFNETELFKKRNDVADMARSAAVTLLALFASAVISGLILSFVYTSRFLKPLSEITQNIRSVALGHMDRQALINTDDEFRMLASEFNNMTSRIKEFEQSTLGSLLEEKNRSVAIVRSITNPLIILNSEDKVSLLNESFEKLFNIKLEDAIDLPFSELKRRNKKLKSYFKDINHRNSKLNDILIAPNDEKDKYYNVALTPLHGKSGYIISLHDISEMKLLDKAKTDFVATVSHEFKTPLTSIIMGVDLLNNNELGPLTKKQQEIVNVIKEDGLRLSELVYDLLEMSKIESSLTIYNFELCDLEALLKKAIKQFSLLASQHNLKLEFKEDSLPIPLAYADTTKITWVINNLFSNAVKNTSSGDKITARIHANQHYIYVSIKDTGAGIAPETLDRLFKRHIEVSSYEIEMRGSGLGLALSKEIIIAHGCDMWCKSELGHGSTFTFCLKRADESLRGEKM